MRFRIKQKCHLKLVCYSAPAQQYTCSANVDALLGESSLSGHWNDPRIDRSRSGNHLQELFLPESIKFLCEAEFFCFKRKGTPFPLSTGFKRDENSSRFLSKLLVCDRKSRDMEGTPEQITACCTPEQRYFHSHGRTLQNPITSTDCLYEVERSSHNAC